MYYFVSNSWARESSKTRPYFTCSGKQKHRSHALFQQAAGKRPVHLPQTSTFTREQYFSLSSERRSVCSELRSTGMRSVCSAAIRRTIWKLFSWWKPRDVTVRIYHDGGTSGPA